MIMMVYSPKPLPPNISVGSVEAKKVSFYSLTFYVETLLHCCLLMLLCMWPPKVYHRELRRVEKPASSSLAGLTSLVT